jgi:hypothetical protein
MSHDPMLSSSWGLLSLPFVKLKSAGNPHAFRGLQLKGSPAWNIEICLQKMYLWISAGDELL